MRQFNFTTLACAFTLMLSASVFAQQIECCDLGATAELGPLDEMAPSCGTTYEVGPAFEVPCEPYEPGIPVCSQCLEVGCDGNCHRICRRLGFYGGAVYDEFVSKFAERVRALRVRQGLEPEINMGPVTSLTARETIAAKVDAAVAGNDEAAGCLCLD